MNKKTFSLCIVIGLLISIRSIFNKSSNMTYIVASVNIIAFSFVVYTIIEKIVFKIIGKIRESNVPIKIINREIRKIRTKVWGLGGIVVVGLIVIYLICYCSNLGNDIISILALGFSVLDDDIIDLISENYRI